MTCHLCDSEFDYIEILDMQQVNRVFPWSAAFGAADFHLGLVNYFVTVTQLFRNSFPGQIVPTPGPFGERSATHRELNAGGCLPWGLRCRQWLVGVWVGKALCCGAGLLVAFRSA